MPVYTSIRLVGAIVLFTMASVVNAAEPKIPSWYWAIEAGDVSPGDDDFEDTEVSSFNFGRQFSEKRAFEFGYVDLGRYEFLELTEDDDDVNGVQFCLLHMLPVKIPATLYLELGFLIEGAGYNPFSIFGIGEEGYVEATYLFGFGAMFDLSETFGGRVAFRRYNDTSAERLDTLTYGLYLRF